MIGCSKMSYNKHEKTHFDSDQEVAQIQAKSIRMEKRESNVSDDLLADLTPVLIAVKTPHLSPRILDSSYEGTK